tara:strand:- start:55339 stop:57312 length:1974 start_codon:yes stop_codon:yes gene_type:complete
MTGKFFSLLLFTSLYLQIFAVGQQQDFGDISRAMLEMEVYEKDSTADAVVLFDVGEVYVTEKLEVNYERHIRIKILTDKGLDAGDISISFRDDFPEQEIKGIKAESQYIDENGKVIKTKVGRRDRFENKISDTWKEVKFTIPGLRKGSVLEYRYEMKSESAIDIPDWYFQKQYPVIWSEYTLSIPEWFDYLTYTRGYHPFYVNEEEPYNEIANNSWGGGFGYSGTKYHYIMKDVPAIEAEPFMKAKVDYLAQIRFQLASYKFPTSARESVLNSWATVLEAINDSDNYGKRLKSSSLLKEKTYDAIEGTETELDKMIAIYDHVSSVMDWNEDHRFYIEEDLDKIYKKGTGNGSEINLILTQMLKEAGINAKPVAISTTNNGEIIGIYPLDNQFNHTITKVVIDDKVYLLDAKNEKRPYTLLPSSAINGKGFVINENNKIEWIDLKNNSDNRLVNFVNVSINEDGEITGNLQSKNYGYLGYLYKEILSQEDSVMSKEVEEVVFTNADNLKIDSVHVDEETVNEFSYSVDFRLETDNSENVIYLNPMLIEAITENPFKKKTRTYPIDYDYTFNKRVIINFEIPEGWEIAEYPESRGYKLTKNAGGYVRLVQVSGNKLTVRYDYIISRKRLLPTEYDELRFMYDGIVKDNTERVVIKKVAE